MASLMPNGKQQYSNNAGAMLAGGKIYTYAAGTTTPKATYTTATGNVENANPVVLDARGEAVIFWDGSYYIEVKDASDVLIYSVDNYTTEASKLRNDLAESTGSALVGGAAQFVSSIDALRALLKTSASSKAFVTGYYADGDGAGGAYYYDASDTSSTDNGGTIIVATDGGRWKSARPTQITAEGFGAKLDDSNDDTAALSGALTAASATVSAAQGNAVKIRQGTGILSSSINIPNRVSIKGANKRGTILKADAAHSGPYMFTAINGTSSMFDNPLEDLYLNCNDVDGLGGVLSDAWQEGGGLRNVLINNFKTYGVKFQSGYGGAALCEISQSEIFGSSVSAPTAGIQVDQISSVGAFMLSVSHSTIAGATALTSIPIGINMVNDSLYCRNVHFEYCDSGIYLQGAGHHVLIGVTGGPGVTNVVEVSSTFTGTLSMIGCHRAGATNLLRDNRTSGYGIVTGIDTDFFIMPQPNFGAGMTNSCGVFDGTAATPSATNCFGVSSIAKAGTGDYTITETWGRNTANAAVWATSNLVSGHVTVDLVNSTQFRVRIYDASNVLADANEIKFGCARVN